MSRSITPRAAWGYQLRRPVPHAPAKREGLSLHYGAGPEWIGFDAPRGLQSVHFGRGFSTIGYTFVADLAGNLFYGRSVNLRGAHTLGHNTTWHAVCVPANGNTTPTDALIDSLAWLLRHGQIRGWWPLNMAGHGTLSPTSCPGPLDAIIPEVVSQAARGPKTYTDATDIPAPEEGEMLAKFSDDNKIWVLYTGSGKVKHLSPSAYEAINRVEKSGKLGDQFVNLGEQPGLSQAGFR